MRTIRLCLTTVTLALCGMAVATGVHAATLTGPCMVTSVGQSSDIVIVKALLNTQLKMGFDVKPTVQADGLGKIGTLLIVVGASAKGLGAAGIDMPKELDRARALIDAARQQKASILVMHTGGEARRGKTSNDLIDLVVPEADQVVVVASGNQDKHFNSLAAGKQIPVIEVDKLAAAGAAVKALFDAPR